MLPVNHPLGSVVYSAHPGVVDTVLVRGTVVKRDGRLLGADMAHVATLAYESRDRIFGRAIADPNIPGASPGGDWHPTPMAVTSE